MRIDLYLRFFLLAALIVVLFCVRFVISPSADFTARFLLYGSYPMVLCLLAFFTIFIIQTAREHYTSGLDFGGLLRFHGVPLSIILALSIILLIHEPFAFKVLRDEHAHLAHSMMLHLHRISGLPGSSHFVENQIQYFDFFPHMRGPLFATFLSFLHDVSGYRPANAFLLNAILGFLLLLLTYTIAFLWSRERSIALVPVVMVFATPIFAQVINSGSYDLLNAVLLLVFLLAGRLFLSHPGAKQSNLFIVVGLLLAHSRSESILYFLPLSICFLTVWIRLRQIRISLFAAASPLFLIVPLFLNLQYSLHDVYLMPHLREEGRAVMELSYIPENLAQATYFFFNPTAYSVSSSFVSSIILISCLLFFLNIVKKHNRFSNDELIYTVTGFGSLICFALLLSHFWSSFNDYQASRFSIPLFLLGSLSIVFALDRFKARYDSPRTGWIALVAVGLHAFFFGVPQQAAHHVTKSMFPPQYAEWFLEHARNQNNPAILYISKSSLMFAAHGLPAVGFRDTHGMPDREKTARAVRMGLYDEVHVSELYSISSNNPKILVPVKNFEQYGADFRLETLDEFAFTPFLLGRISRLKSVRLESGEWLELQSRSDNLPAVSNQKERKSVPYLLLP